MPKLLRARAPEDAEEERKIGKLAGSRHAPGRLDIPRPDHLFELAGTSHHQDR